MTPRNLTLFRFPPALDLSDLEATLGECTLKPVGPLEMASRGFVSPFGPHGEALSHALDDANWLTVGGEDKILPGAVVNDLLAKKLREMEEQEGRRPGGRTRKRIKEELVTQLLPRAFVRPSRTDVFIDRATGVVAIDTASRKVAEGAVSEIRAALGSFPALPLNAEVAPRAILTGWLSGDPLPEGLSLGDECTLVDPSDTGAQVRCSGQELLGEEIEKHLEAGKQVTRLALVLEDHVSFVLGEDLVIRKFKLLDGAVENLDSTERDDIAAELDARFALFAGEFRRLFDVLAQAFKLSAADAGDPAVQAQQSHDRKARRAHKPMEGIESITISMPGGPSVTVSPDRFLKIGNLTEKMVELAAWVRATGKTTISAMQRELGCGYNQAARVIELLESMKVVSAPDAQGKRSVLPIGGGA